MALRARNYNAAMSIPNRHALSPVFVALPWACEELVQSPKGILDFQRSMPAHTHFLGALHAYESWLLMFGGKCSGAELLQLLRVDVEYAPSESTASRVLAVRAIPTSMTMIFDYLKISSHVCAFRLFEELGLLAGSLTRSSMAFHLPTLSLPKPSGESSTLFGLEKLDDWPKVMLDFRRIVLDATKKDRGTDFVPQIKQQRGYSNIVDNFLSAAIHIYLMRMINVPDGVLPDYPADLESQKYNIFKDSSPDSKHLSDVMDGGSLYLEELYGDSHQEKGANKAAKIL
ncbi:hypothetical protein CPB84DRAFT_1893494 [Gymnopilus junonius]|uniref:Uncharacterized protein n=1 Tax=Gymnopilus junonius TaxID=109634 RepID=A0A9P5N9A9_GYMJU|nr:hypothetical protein CPB84DRAFT_1893494 [Gymnopilus junonius]